MSGGPGGPGGSGETVLIFRLGSLGDTVVALPCFHAIAQRFPNAHRVVLTNRPVSAKAPSLASILQFSGLVHDVIDFKSPLTGAAASKLGWTIRTMRPARLIFLAVRPSRLAFWRDLAFFRACGIGHIIGGKPWRELRPRVAGPHGEIEPMAEFLVRTVPELGPVDLDDRANWDLRLTLEERAAGEALVAPLSGRGFLAVSAGGKALQNNWGSENWGVLLGALSQRFPGLGLLLVGSSDEAPSFDAMGARWRHGPAVNAAGRLQPREAAAALARARAFIGHDSGPLHLAAAVNVPTLGLFGDYNRPRLWHPYGREHRVIHDMAGMAAIEPERVIEASVALLEERAGRTGTHGRRARG